MAANGMDVGGNRPIPHALAREMMSMLAGASIAEMKREELVFVLGEALETLRSKGQAEFAQWCTTKIRSTARVGSVAHRASIAPLLQLDSLINTTHLETLLGCFLGGSPRVVGGSPRVVSTAQQRTTHKHSRTQRTSATARVYSEAAQSPRKARAEFKLDAVATCYGNDFQAWNRVPFALKDEAEPHWDYPNEQSEENATNTWKLTQEGEEGASSHPPPRWWPHCSLSESVKSNGGSATICRGPAANSSDRGHFAAHERQTAVGGLAREWERHGTSY